MTLIGQVESLWRYPVKSMMGEQLAEAYCAYGGVYGDRRYAFLSSAAPEDFPFLTAREKPEMLLCRASYRHWESMIRPDRRLAAEAAALDVLTSSGEVFAVDDPRLLDILRSGLGVRHELGLIKSDAAITDSRPLSLFSLQTARQLGAEVDLTLDKRRFRANIYVDLLQNAGFKEDELVGRRLAVGARVVLAILKRNVRCKIITLDPDSTQAAPEVMKTLAKEHESRAGIYAAVLVEGMVAAGDEVRLIAD